jgi:uncharacterized protein (TIGR02118 family)
MVSSRAAERFDALSTRTGELDDRSNRSLPGRPRPHIRHGIGGSTPRAPAAFVAMVHATFDSAEVFASAFAPYAAELQRDAPNYTNIQPVVQISEVLIA